MRTKSPKNTLSAILSKTTNRKDGGASAKKFGDLFESRIEMAAKQSGLLLIKIPTGGRMIKRGGRLEFIRQASPFDFILQAPGRFPVYIDAKTRDQKKIPYSGWFSHKSTHEQVMRLNEAAKFGTPAGFLVWFRPIDRVTFIPAHIVSKLSSGESLGCSDGVNCGTFETPRIDRIFENRYSKSLFCTD